jgi:hypothetical protein
MKLDPEHHLPRVGREGIGPGQVDRSSTGRAAGGESRAGRSGAAPGGDGLVLSREADRFRQLRTRLEELPEPSRPERVRALQGLVAAGRYRVEGDRVAGAVLKDEATAAALGLSRAR